MEMFLTSLKQVQNRPYHSPQQTPGHAFDFYRKILVKFPGLLTVSMVKCTPASASKRVKSPTHQRLLYYVLCKILLSKTEISKIWKSGLTKVCSFQ